MTPNTGTMLITGAASGIGLHLVQHFAARGWHIIATDRDAAALQSQATRYHWQPDQVMVRVLDVCDPSAWREVVAQGVEQWGRLDVLLNVAGVLLPGYISEATDEQIDLHLDVNTRGTMYGTRIAAEYMLKQGRGHIINIASLAGIAPIPGIGLYSASKFAVRGFSIAAGIELRRQGIAVTVICPDAVQTPMLDRQKDHAAAALTFSGNILTVEDIAAAIDRALQKKPLEITLPRTRGWLAKISNLFPGLGIRLAPFLTRHGAKRQRRLRG